MGVECVGSREFDETVASFDGVAHEITSAFAAARWPGLAREPLVFRAGGKPVAAALVLIWRMPVIGAAVAVSKWGPVLASETEYGSAEIYDAAIDHLIAEYAVRRRMMLSVMARAEKDWPLLATERLKRRGFWFGTAFPFPNFYFVRILGSEADQRRSYSQKWRYHLSRSERQGLAFEVANASDLPRFQALYEAMSRRKRFPDYSAYQTLEQVLSEAPDSVAPRLFLVTKDKRDLAGAVVFTAGRTAAYLYGATCEEALPLRAGYFMHDRVIDWLRANSRAEWYDLGGSDGFQGLHQFKKGMIGNAGLMAQVPAVASFAAHLRPRVVGKTLYAMRDGLQRCRRLARLCTGRCRLTSGSSA